MTLNRWLALLIGLTTLTGAAPHVSAEDRFITVASTTSTQSSGLFEHLLPHFEDKTGIDVRVVAVGTGKAIRMARNGDVDVLLVHHKSSEEEFVAEGYGLARKDLMYNDFVIVGPETDPAGVKGMNDASDALAAIADAEAVFISRGDDSGTHKAEKGLWAEFGAEPVSGTWYRSTGLGMGATLNMAAAVDGYALTDRGTWLSFQNRGNLNVLVEGDEALFNPYGVIVVNPDRHPHIKKDDAQVFVDWLTTAEGQQAIAGYKIDGQQLFFPNAGTGS